MAAAATPPHSPLPAFAAGFTPSSPPPPSPPPVTTTAGKPATGPPPASQAGPAAAAATVSNHGSVPPSAGAAAPLPVSSLVRRKKTLGSFLRIFTYTTRAERALLCAAVLAALGAGVAFPAMTLVIGRLIGRFTSVWADGVADKTADEVQREMQRAIEENVLYIVYLFIARFVLGYIAILGFHTLSLRISATLRLAYLSALLGQRVSLLEAQPAGQTAAILTTTAAALQAGLAEPLAALCQGVGLAAAAVVLALARSAELAGVTAAGLAFVVACFALAVPRAARLLRAVEAAHVAAAAVAAEAFAAVRIVAACGAEDAMARRHARWVAEAEEKGRVLARIVGLQQGTVFFCVFSTFALCFWYAVRMLLQGKIQDSGTLVVVLMCIMMIVMTVGSIAAPMSAASRSVASAGILFNGIDAPRPTTKGLRPPAVSAATDIVLWNVNFTYPTRPTLKVLDDLKLILPAGKVTALVGPSGSGKSTIVGLIERWYELDGDDGPKKLISHFRNGVISVGGTKLHDIDLEWWRSQIGLVTQEPFLFQDTIFRNVSHGLVGTAWEDAPEAQQRELVETACREAYADEFIARLPEGLDTPVGAAGLQLSGGQRQRLAIARAIVRQPQILIFDEATSSIDVRGEAVVQAALDRVARNRTTVLIAHRLATVKRADHIVVLNRGRVVQWGTHDSLLAQPDGPYWRLTQAQQLALGPEDENEEEQKEQEEHRPGEAAGSDVTDAEKRSGAAPATPSAPKTEPASEVDGDTSSQGPRAQATGVFRSFGTMLLEQKPLWPWYLLMMAGVLIAGASSPVQAYLMAALLSSLGLWGEYLVIVTNFWCLMFVALACAVGLGYGGLGFAGTRIAFTVTSAYRREYFANLVRQPTAFFDEAGHSAGALAGRAATDPTQLQQLLGTNAAFALGAALGATGSLGLAFAFGWRLAAAALGAAAPLAVAAGVFRLRGETALARDAVAVFAEGAAFATEAVAAVRTVSALTLEPRLLRRYDALLRAHVARAIRRQRFQALVFAGSDAMPLLCMAFVLWYGGTLVVKGEYSTFNYLVVYIAVIQGSLGAGQWLSFGPNIAQATVAANRIKALRGKLTDEDAGIDLPLNPAEPEVRGVKVELKDVWFRYPTRDVPVLCGLDMTIEKGQFAAIVGPSGSGKTSIVSLLERFYEPISGEITVNGTATSAYALAPYRRALSLVAQEPSLFEGTIRENILLGLEENEATEEAAQAAEAASRAAALHDFVAALPEGYGTRVGASGVLLSGGQRQRLALARALARRPRLLLLDEATASLDSATEGQVMTALLDQDACTRVVVAHRLASVQNADVIFVLGDGRVVEKGSHAELLQRCGVYYRMCQAQALDR